jgi:hypothetical protein
MSEEKKNYDREFDQAGSYELDHSEPDERNTCCSCHINPPCSYCENQNKDHDDE